MAIDKRKLLEVLRARAAAALQSLQASQAEAQAGAFHEENRQEHAKDTRAIEGAYLARGLAERAENAADTVAALATLELRDFGEGDPIALGAAVALDDGAGARKIYFLVPLSGGETLECEGGVVHAITPSSPIGRALIGEHAGGDVTLELPRGAAAFTIAWVV